MAPTLVNVMYPAAASADFNMDYYLGTHMPFVQKNWGPHGLKSWNVAVLDKETSGYHVQCVLVFETAEGFKTAMSEDKEILPDVANFTATKPNIWIGAVTRQWSA
ncbi:ethyl tert-butyl ether degradation EthD [Apiospora phragmitis]|uniref:Ethyl tert-butyl ether degradation EthD n=1 Tax=Apiospora phragmitis TaxID=2905665 RepID=A0ABR1V0D7_9PEZI